MPLLDRFARSLAQAGSRRSAFAAIAGAGLAVLGASQPGVEAKPSKNKRKRCKKGAQRCRQDAAGFCGFVWPDFYGPCTFDLNQCCSHYAQCQGGKASACFDNSVWLAI
jgi:hypothetical protein